MSNPVLNVFYYMLTVLVAMALKVMPLPGMLQLWNPDWVVLVLIYWVLVLPYKFGVFSSCIAGLFTDVLTGRTLGEHALVYAIASYVCLKLHKRVRAFPILQQGVFIFLLLLFVQTMLFGIESISNPSRFRFSFLLPVVSGTLIWPFAGMILRFIRMSQRVG